MHLLAAQPGGFSDEEGIIDLQQTPGEIVILSSQDTSLGLLADVMEEQKKNKQSVPFPTVRLANLVNLIKPAAYDLYEHKIIQHSKLVIVSLLGGIPYWSYGVNQLIAISEFHNIQLVVVPGDDQPDPDLINLSTCSPQQHHAIWRYLREGGKRNTRNLFSYIKKEFFSTAKQETKNNIESTKSLTSHPFIPPG